MTDTVGISGLRVSYNLCYNARGREYGAMEQIKTTDEKLLLKMDRLDMSDGAIRHCRIPDYLVSNGIVEPSNLSVQGENKQ